MLIVEDDEDFFQKAMLQRTKEDMRHHDGEFMIHEIKEEENEGNNSAEFDALPVKEVDFVEEEKDGFNPSPEYMQTNYNEDSDSNYNQNPDELKSSDNNTDNY